MDRRITFTEKEVEALETFVRDKIMGMDDSEIEEKFINKDLNAAVQKLICKHLELVLS